VRGRSWILCVGTLASLPCSWAQSPASPPKPEEPPAYEDKLIEGGNLAALPPDEGASTYNPVGLPREWRVEGFASRLDQGGVIRHENGMVLSGRLETLEYGSYTLDATVRGNGSQSVVTLYQRGLPFDNGWKANNGLGMLNTPAIDLSRQQYRFYVPTFPIAGLETEWIRNGNLQLQASVGSPGVYSGLRVAGFTRLDGTVFTAGAQWAPTPGVQAGVQMADARGVQSGLNADDPLTSARTWYGALALQDGPNARIQLNALDSQANEGRHDLAVWIDGEARDGRYRHNYGVFRFEPNMFWGYTPINSDLMGGYYRLNYQSQQWIWALGLDSVTSVTSAGTSGLFATGNARYQFDTTLGAGGGATLRHSGTDASSVYAFVDKKSFLGTTRTQVDLVDAQGSQHGEQITIDHAWPTKVGLRLSTALSFSRQTDTGVRTTLSSFSAFGGIDLTNNLSLEGNVRWSLEREAVRTVGTYANVGLVWRISPRWSLVANYYDNRSETQAFATIAPLVPVDALVPVPRDRAIFVTVRYEDHAGTPVAPLGGAPGSGAGMVVGYIWYDANDDGRRAANETGAANVTVLLDGKFAGRTNSDGKFEFPFVAAGPHSIVVVPDNLALPYSIEGDGRREISVRTRETTSIDIPATKLR
jgi:hypothetical protein